MPNKRRCIKGGLGKALQKQLREDKRKLREGNQVHKGKDLPYQNVLASVTEQTDISDFMDRLQVSETATGLSGGSTSTTIRLLSSSQACGILTEEEMKNAHTLHRKLRGELRIPRKPHWNRRMTKEELHDAEQQKFAEWRIGLSRVEKVDKIKLTPYEKNVQVWKQLWRVVEKSDVVVQIVDARNPLMFRCCDLEAYVKEVDDKKLNLILVNKSDFLTDSQRKEWTDYFNKKNIFAVFFSALADDVRNTEPLSTIVEQSDKTEEILTEENQESLEDESKDLEDESKDLEDESKDLEDESKDLEDESKDLEDESKDLEDESKDLEVESEEHTITDNTYETAKENLEEEWEDCDDEQSLDGEESFDEDISENLEESDIEDNLENRVEEEVMENNNLNLMTIDKVYNRDELIELFASVYKKEEEGKEVVIGLVGYPNVGKSSTINCLMSGKKVTVSATPGKTKHFQTLYLREDLVLCDCPGLVFPGFVTSRQEMIMWGILPIDHIKRQNQSAVTYLCSIIPPRALEETYGVKLPGGDGRTPDSDEFLSVHALMRGSRSHGRPNTSDSARLVLKDFMNGHLLHCVAPPGVDQKTYHVHEDSIKKRHVVPLTAQQKLFMPETPEDVEENINFLNFDIPREKPFEMRGKKAGRERVKAIKGRVEYKHGQDGNIVINVTKPYRNKPSKTREGKKNHNTNNPYADENW